MPFTLEYTVQSSGNEARPTPKRSPSVIDTSADDEPVCQSGSPLPAIFRRIPATPEGPQWAKVLVKRNI